MAQGKVLVQLFDEAEELRKMEMPTANELYSYWKLQERGWLRILSVEPPPEPQYRISCSLLHQPIKGGQDYEALSYTWGTDEAIATIFVDGGVLFVRYNLYCALRNLRHPTKRRVLWVDALCINQDDATELNNQVSQLADIYSSSIEVLVWLGEGNKYTDRGMDFLGEISAHAKLIEDRILKERSDRHQMYKEWTDLFHSVHARHDSDECFAGIGALFFGDWWNRVWTVQEITLARAAKVQVGKKSLPWECFEIFSKLYTVYAVHTSGQVRPEWTEKYRIFQYYARQIFIKADTIRVMRIKLLENIEIPLSLMVQYTLRRFATDPRDKIYAILRLINCGPRISPDYSLSCNKVYTSAFRAMLEYFGDLRVYNFLQGNHPDGGKELPSWVPEFMALTRSGISNMAIIDGS